MVTLRNDFITTFEKISIIFHWFIFRYCWQDFRKWSVWRSHLKWIYFVPSSVIGIGAGVLQSNEDMEDDLRGPNKVVSYGNRTEGDDDQDWRQLNSILYIFKKWFAYLGSLFLWPRFPLHTCARGWSFFHCDQQLVVVRVLVERGLASHMIQRHLLEGHGAKQET